MSTVLLNNWKITNTTNQIACVGPNRNEPLVCLAPKYSEKSQIKIRGNLNTLEPWKVVYLDPKYHADCVVDEASDKCKTCFKDNRCGKDTEQWIEDEIGYRYCQHSYPRVSRVYPNDVNSYLTLEPTKYDYDTSYCQYVLSYDTCKTFKK